MAPRALVVVRACLVLAAAVAAACGGGGDAPSAAPGQSTAAAPAPAPADPMKDPAAWRALPESERADRASRVALGVDPGDRGAVDRAREFLAARDERSAVESLARRVVERDPSSSWARSALGEKEVGAEVDACLRRCELAEEADDPAFEELKALRDGRPGTWWAGAEEARKVAGLVAAAAEAEKRLASPFEQAVAKWVRWQRAIEIMKDHPALTGVAGPYLVFVSLNTPSGAAMKDVPAAELDRGRKILDRNKELFADFYGAWMREVGPLLGLTRYGPDNADDRTILKANVFTKPEDFYLYNLQVGAGGGFVRAYYSYQEPRFITTYDGGGQEDPQYTDQVQCHEATHQLVHFYTWDLSRKALGFEPDWLHCAVRPLWSNEGFAEFFSSFRVVDGKRVWMQPLDERLHQIWTFEPVVRERGWIPWRLKEFFTMRHGGQLNNLSEARTKVKGEEVVATGLMSNLFYAKAWSFVHFLWYAEAGGRPKYRDRYVRYLKFEFLLKYPQGHTGKTSYPYAVHAGDFGEIMGLASDADWEALEKEWQAYTDKLVAASKRPDWDKRRDELIGTMGVDKLPPPAKVEPPKPPPAPPKPAEPPKPTQPPKQPTPPTKPPKKK